MQTKLANFCAKFNKRKKEEEKSLKEFVTKHFGD